MRADLSTIQQTLTPEAAAVLNQSIAEAGRRNHGQTTPLHVAATLLASPSGYLRQACIRSHPNSSHPLQCRALELCFSVALERLPTAQSPGQHVPEPPVSNALMAALKRAQAHQRRGCPEQQQQPLLAVKVELEQLIISILDDPSVSRVMREASFSSPAVKTAIEQTLNNNSPNSNIATAAAAVNRNLYLNPRLQQTAVAQAGQRRDDEVRRVLDILVRSKKRNPVLVGETEPEILVTEVLEKIARRELEDTPLRNVNVIRLDKAEMVKELGGLIERRMMANSSDAADAGGVILDLGDLKWLVDNQVVGRAAVVEMGKLLERYGARLWLIGTATCETYLRCQVYHPSMENDWDLQAVPITMKSLYPGMFPRLGNNGILLSNTIDAMAPIRNFPPAAAVLPRPVYESPDPAQRMSFCPQCKQNYERELAELKRSSVDRSLLPQWLQAAKANDNQTSVNDQELVLKRKSQELLKKWNGTCLRIHCGYHHQQSLMSSERIVPVPVSLTSLCSPIPSQLSQPKLQPKSYPSDTLQLIPNSAGSPPESPVRTDLVLGGYKLTDSSPEKIHEERITDLLGSNKLQVLKGDKVSESLDIDSFKRLLKGLTEKVWWQHDAASALAGTVSQCKLGGGRRRGGAAASKGDIWLLFTGPDRVGKKKMALALSDLVYGASPITISLGSRRGDGRELDLSFRGKTVLDRIAEAVKRNPFSVIMLEDIDEADMLLRGSIKRAMERGRITDSYGREISQGNVIFVLTTNWSPENNEFPSKNIDENKLRSLVSGRWQLRLSVCEKTSKRRPSWLDDTEERSMRPKKDAPSFDLNEAADTDDDKANGSPNSSDLTIDHDQEERRTTTNRLSSQTIPSIYRELVSFVDDAIFFRPVDFTPIKNNIADSLKKRSSSIIGEGSSIEIQDDALERIAGGTWVGQMGLEEWMEKVLSPSLHQLKSRLLSITNEEPVIVRLELDDVSDDWSPKEFLPGSIKLVVD